MPLGADGYGVAFDPDDPHTMYMETQVGNLQRVELDDEPARVEPDMENLLSLDAALDGLEALDPTMASVVKLRYFAGMTISETADALGLSPRSVNRTWTAARAWLHREMNPSGGAAASS